MGVEQSKYNLNPIHSEERVFALTQRPVPSDREVAWDKSKILICKTDSKGMILYANDAYIDVSGYEDYELITKNSNISRHPDMPKVLFKIMWENISKGKNFTSVIKNMAKTGRFYWVIHVITTSKDKNGEYVYTCNQKYISENNAARIKICKLYNRLLHIEQASGVVASENYLVGLLEEHNQNFREYIESILDAAAKTTIATENVSIAKEATETASVITSAETTSYKNDDDEIEKIDRKSVEEIVDSEIVKSDVVRIKKKGFFSGFFANDED